MILTEEMVNERLSFARSVEWDEYKCSAEWHIARPAVRLFIRTHRNPYTIAKPEWENKWVNDLQVLTRREYIAEYNISESEYFTRLRKAERKHGKIATPEIRAEWMRKYWEER